MVGFLEKSALPALFEILQRYSVTLLQLLAIRILFANSAEKIHRAMGMAKMWCVGTGRNGAKVLRTFQHRRAFSATLQIEK
jgi:hypothetical protein